MCVTASLIAVAPGQEDMIKILEKHKMKLTFRGISTLVYFISV